jgi:murein DD-endopeptidase MepM/ murein hydrolase activator NlpD
MVLVMAGLLVAGLAQPLQAASVDDLNKQLEEIKNIRQGVAGELSIVRSKIRGTEAEIDELRQQIRESEKEVAAKEKAYDEAAAKVSEAQKRVELKQAEVAERQAIMRTRARATYEEGKTSTLSMLLQATSFSDLLSRVEYLKCLDDKDKALLDDLQARQRELEDEQAELKAQMDVAEALKEEAADAKNKLDQKNMDLADSLAEYQKKLDELNKTDKEMEAEAQKIYADIQAQSGQTGQSTGNGTLSKWPVPSQQSVISGFRTASRPNHNGIDISTGLGARVVAAGDGNIVTVSKCGHHNFCGNWLGQMVRCNGGYGNYIVIDHGNGVTTLYAHLQGSYFPAKGSVKAGDLVGYMGSTGNSSGSHLHFEVRINGSAVNPMNYRSQMK